MVVIIPTLACRYDRAERGIPHERISSDADFRYPPRPPLPDAHREFPSRERAYRRDASRSRRQHRRCRLRRSDAAATISNSQNRCTTRFPSTASTCPAITTSATTRPRSARRPRSRRRKNRQAFLSAIGEDRWCFEAAGWWLIGLNSLIMNTGLASEAEQFDWLAAQLASAHGKPVALFLHKPLFLNTPDDPEREATAIRYVPQPARGGWSRCSARSICGWSPPATCISAAISPIATSATSGRLPPASSFPTSGRKRSAQGDRPCRIPLRARQF